MGGRESWVGEDVMLWSETMWEVALESMTHPSVLEELAVLFRTDQSHAGVVWPWTPKSYKHCTFICYRTDYIL
jgi:hypothetical protein